MPTVTSLLSNERAQDELMIQRMFGQKEQVAELQAEGRPKEDALGMLDTFLDVLVTLDYHQRLLLDGLKAKTGL